MSTSSVSSSLEMSPCFAFLPEEVIRCIVLHLPNHSICCASQVSKLWSHTLNSDAFWRALTEKRFFEVENIDKTTPKQVFLELNSMTTFGREKVEEVFGKIRDPIPVLSRGGFTLLSGNDPLGDLKKIKENYCLVLKPPRVFLPFKQDFFDLLLQSKDGRDFPSISSRYPEEMEIPLTLTNMKKIYEYRHSEHPNGSAFATKLFSVAPNWLNDSEEEADEFEACEQFYDLKALEQCNQSSEETSIWLIRKEPALYKMDLATQNEVIKNCVLNVVPADIVVEANAISNYQTGGFLSIDLDTD
ncbi:MAG TPA: F-box protein, partial [Nitrosopumilaceae archaeon]|nr:F-box protein [Nitrosopumilaceae archaeon]